MSAADTVRPPVTLTRGEWAVLGVSCVGSIRAATLVPALFVTAASFTADTAPLSRLEPAFVVAAAAWLEVGRWWQLVVTAAIILTAARWRSVPAIAAALRLTHDP